MENPVTLPGAGVCHTKVDDGEKKKKRVPDYDELALNSFTVNTEPPGGLPSLELNMLEHQHPVQFPEMDSAGCRIERYPVGR